MIVNVTHLIAHFWRDDDDDEKGDDEVYPKCIGQECQRSHGGAALRRCFTVPQLHCSSGRGYAVRVYERAIYRKKKQKKT